MLGLPFLFVHGAVEKSLQPAIRGFPTSHFIRKVGNSVDNLTDVLRAQGGLRHTPLFRTSWSLYFSRYSPVVPGYSITPVQYGVFVISNARMRTASLRATATIAFFVLPEFRRTR